MNWGQYKGDTPLVRLPGAVKVVGSNTVTLLMFTSFLNFIESIQGNSIVIWPLMSNDPMDHSLSHNSQILSVKKTYLIYVSFTPVTAHVRGTTGGYIFTGLCRFRTGAPLPWFFSISLVLGSLPEGFPVWLEEGYPSPSQREG